MNYKLVNENYYENYSENLLKHRGITDIKEFLNPTENSLQNPFDLENMKEGIDLLEKHLTKKNDILLIVDSDADGMTSSSILYQYIKDHYPAASLDYWLHEGKQHGLEDHIKPLLDTAHTYKLVILPDASSNDYEYHEKLAEIDVEVLVIDHHLAEPPFSDNAVIINNQLSPDYLNKELTGAGVVLQFCRAWDSIKGTHFADKYYDLAAVGIVADMGSVLELENRYIFAKGLKFPTENYFLNKLYGVQKYSMTGDQYADDQTLSDAITPEGVAWYIGPMINAVIRSGSQLEKQNLFLAMIDGKKLIPCNKRGAKGTLEEAAIESIREATNARSRQNKQRDKMMEQLEIKIAINNLLDNKVLVIELDDNDNFPPELNGLTAIRIADKYKHPTLIVRRNREDFLKGSLRNPNGTALTSLKDYLESTELFEFVEGHNNAAGLSLPGKNLDRFIEKSNQELAHIDFGEIFHSINFMRSGQDSDIGALILDISRHDDLWGQKNPKPKILVENLLIQVKDISIRGAKRNVIAFNVNGVGYVKFKAEQEVEQLDQFAGTDHISIDVIGAAKINDFRGTFTPEIWAEEMKISKKKYSF